ncbi:MAG: hypothetical protein E7415_01330 [Ruminococcaceae bacterium]|nr:hypothetical protein [Oscillospiraceae bacterium]
MSIYTGDKKATLYKGNYMPATLTKGDNKIAGFEKKTFSGSSLQINGTYNEKPDNITIYGGFKPSKNLFNPILTEHLWPPSGTNQEIRIDTSGYSGIIAVKPSTVYIMSGTFTGMNGSCMRIAQTEQYPEPGVLTIKRTDISAPSYSSGFVITRENCHFLLCATGTSEVNDYTSGQIQLEEGRSRTEYEPYTEPISPVLTWNNEEIPVPYPLCTRADGTDYIELCGDDVTLNTYEHGYLKTTVITETEFGKKLKELRNKPQLTTASVSLGTLAVTTKVSL